MGSVCHFLVPKQLSFPSLVKYLMSRVLNLVSKWLGYILAIFSMNPDNMASALPPLIISTACPNILILAPQKPHDRTSCSPAPLAGVPLYAAAQDTNLCHLGWAFLSTHRGWHVHLPPKDMSIPMTCQFPSWSIPAQVQLSYLCPNMP